MHRAVLATLLAATPLSAQEVLLRFRPPPGQVTRYMMVMEMYMRGGPMAEMGADLSRPFTRMTAWQTNTITTATDDQFTLRQVFDSARVESPAMPQMSQMMGQVGEMMRGTTSVARTTNRGRVLDMEVRLSPAMQEMAGAAGAASGGLPGGVGGPGSNPLHSLWLLPEGPVRVGDTWRDSMTVALDSAGVTGGTLDYAATFTLLRMEGQVAVIGIAGTLTTSGAPLPSPMSFGLTGFARLDLAAGRVVSTTTDMNGTLPMPGGEVPMKMHVTITAQ